MFGLNAPVVVLTIWIDENETILRAARINSSHSHSDIRFSNKINGGQVLDVVAERLLTPVGPRSLSPGHPEYISRDMMVIFALEMRHIIKERCGPG